MVGRESLATIGLQGAEPDRSTATSTNCQPTDDQRASLARAGQITRACGNTRLNPVAPDRRIGKRGVLVNGCFLIAFA